MHFHIPIVLVRYPLKHTFEKLLIDCETHFPTVLEQGSETAATNSDFLGDE